jgi:hypothetical protein
MAPHFFAKALCWHTRSGSRTIEHSRLDEYVRRRQDRRWEVIDYLISVARLATFITCPFGVKSPRFRDAKKAQGHAIETLPVKAMF